MEEEKNPSDAELIHDELYMTETAPSPEVAPVEPMLRTRAMLDTLSEDESNNTDASDSEEIPSTTPSVPTRGPDGRFIALSNELNRDKPVIEPSEGDDAEVTELLEGVTSERSRGRIKEVLAQRHQYAKDLNDIREMLSATGMQPQDFAQTLEFGRLMNANDQQSLQLALQMVETQRETLCQKLGIERPGVDALAAYPDLAQDVQNSILPRERALEIAKLRSEHQSVQQSLQAETTQRQAQQQFEQSIAQGQQAIAGYLHQRAQEADHPVRMQTIHEYFAKPANVQAFVSTYQPNQWSGAIQWMYEQIRLAAPQSNPTPQPLRTPATKLTAASINAQAEPVERLAQRLESMGL